MGFLSPICPGASIPAAETKRPLRIRVSGLGFPTSALLGCLTVVLRRHAHRMMGMMMVTAVGRRGHNKTHTRTVSISPSIEFHNSAVAELKNRTTRRLLPYRHALT